MVSIVKGSVAVVVVAVLAVVVGGTPRWKGVSEVDDGWKVPPVASGCGKA